MVEYTTGLCVLCRKIGVTPWSLLSFVYTQDWFSEWNLGERNMAGKKVVCRWLSPAALFWIS